MCLRVKFSKIRQLSPHVVLCECGCLIIGIVDASIVHMVVMKKPAHQAPKPSVQPKVEASSSQPAESVHQTPPTETQPSRPVGFAFYSDARFPACRLRTQRILHSVEWSSQVHRLWK